jgi:hypothetical protein
MASAIITNGGWKILLNRTFKASPDYTPPSKFTVGISQATPQITDSSLTNEVPIEDGTVNDDGSNTLTGSTGGDNSTDNTTRYKEGGGTSDLTGQNLIANDTNVSKIWTISNLATNGTVMTATEPFSAWIYINDATALAKFATSGTAIEIKLGSDSSNYYSKTWEASDLATGWNYLDSGTTAVNALTETGTVSGNIDTFIIEITTNNATDTFVAGDVVYDLLRQWATTDLVKTILAGYPTVNEGNYESEIRAFLDSTEGNGFDIDGVKYLNADASPLTFFISKHNSVSKSDTDEIEYQTVFRRE